MKRTTIELAPADQALIEQLRQIWREVVGELSLIGVLRLALRLAVTVTPKHELVEGAK